MSGDSFDLETFREYVARSDDHIVLNMAPAVIAEVESLRAEVDRLRLTDAERTFLQNLRGAYEELANQTGYVNAAAQKEAREFADLLSGLLEKHKGGA